MRELLLRLAENQRRMTQYAVETLGWKILPKANDQLLSKAEQNGLKAISASSSVVPDR